MGGKDSRIYRASNNFPLETIEVIDVTATSAESTETMAADSQYEIISDGDVCVNVAAAPEAATDASPWLNSGDRTPCFRTYPWKLSAILKDPLASECKLQIRKLFEPDADS